MLYSKNSRMNNKDRIISETQEKLNKANWLIDTLEEENEWLEEKADKYKFLMKWLTKKTKRKFYNDYYNQDA